MLNTSASSLDDKVLIEMTLAERNECFDLLMDRHLWVIRKRLGSMISNKAEAEDVTQVALLKMWTHLFFPVSFELSDMDQPNCDQRGVAVLPPHESGA